MFVSTARIEAGTRLKHEILWTAGIGCGLGLLASLLFVSFYVGPLIRVDRKCLRQTGANDLGGDRGGAVEERVFGQHEPRNPHPDERRARHAGAPARHHARRQAKALHRHPEHLGQRLDDGAERHLGLLQDRSGQGRAAPGPLSSREPCWKKWRSCLPRAPSSSKSNSCVTCTQTCRRASKSMAIACVKW